MPPTNEPAVKDFVTWFFTAVALLWNLYNFRYARNLRRDTLSLDEWKLERTELRRAMRTFDDEVDLLFTLGKGAHSRDDLLEQITDSNRKIALAHGRLVREAERSTVLGVPPALAYGAPGDGESSWDRLNEKLAEVSVLTDVSAMRATIPAIVVTARTITADMDKFLNAQRSERLTKI